MRIPAFGSRSAASAMKESAAILCIGTLLSAACASGLHKHGVVVFEGTCDASGAVAIDHRTFAVADDEDNVLRIYDAEIGGPPIGSVDMSGALFGSTSLEADLEAATRLDDLALWLTSHARSKQGTQEASRLLFFATSIPRSSTDIALVGKPYRNLLSDLFAEPSLREFDLRSASKRGPTSEGGLNIEGMTSTPDGAVLVGFRNPVPNGLALVIAIENPAAVFDRGERARLRDVVRLDLDGLGVRALSWWRGRYLIAAGNSGDGGVSRLYIWEGGQAAPELARVDLAEFNPEGFFTPETRDAILILSDDGEESVGGAPCKDSRTDHEKTFRGVWLRLDASTTTIARGR